MVRLRSLVPTRLALWATFGVAFAATASRPTRLRRSQRLGLGGLQGMEGCFCEDEIGLMGRMGPDGSAVADHQRVACPTGGEM